MIGPHVHMGPIKMHHFSETMAASLCKTRLQGKVKSRILGYRTLDLFGVSSGMLSTWWRRSTWMQKSTSLPRRGRPGPSSSSQRRPRGPWEIICKTGCPSTKCENAVWLVVCIFPFLHLEFIDTDLLNIFHLQFRKIIIEGGKIFQFAQFHHGCL